MATNSLFDHRFASLEPSTVTADLTPLLDTVFLIILLLLATLINSSVVRGFPVNLPAFSETTDVQKQNDRIEISVDNLGNIYLDKRALSPESFDTALQALNQSPAETILLRADNTVPYGRVAEVLCRVSNRLPDKQVILVTTANSRTDVIPASSRRTRSAGNPG